MLGFPSDHPLTKPIRKKILIGMCISVAINLIDYSLLLINKLPQEIGIVLLPILTYVSTISGLAGIAGIVVLALSFHDKKMVTSFLYCLLLADFLISGVFSLATLSTAGMYLGFINLLFGALLYYRAYWIIIKTDGLNTQTTANENVKVTLQQLRPLHIISGLIGFSIFLFFLFSMPTSIQMGAIALVPIYFIEFIGPFILAIACNGLLKSKDTPVHIAIHVIALIGIFLLMLSTSNYFCT